MEGDSVSESDETVLNGEASDRAPEAPLSDAKPGGTTAVPGPRRFRDRLPVKLALAFFSVVFLLGASEFVLLFAVPGHALEADWTPVDLVDHSVFWMPLGEKSNPLGTSRHWKPLRGAKPALDPATGVVRIICLGGSNTYGWPYEDPQVAYPAQLEALLNSKASSVSGPRYEVINAGEGGFTIFQGLLYLRGKLLRYKPDIVTAAFGHNDSNDNASIGTTMNDEQYWEWVNRMSDHREFWETIGKLNRLRTFVLLKRLMVQLRRWVIETCLTPSPRVAPDRFEVLLTDFVDLGSESGFRPLLLTESSLNPDHLAEYRKKVHEVAVDTGAQVIDVDFELPRSDAVRKTLFHDQAHPNPEGHRAVARIIAEELLSYRE